MLPTNQTLATLIYLAITYPIISFCFRDGTKNKKGALILSASIAVAALAIKVVSYIYLLQ